MQEKVDKYKILVQLSQSADTPPSSIDFNNLSFPNDLIFTSSNELSFNNWHHVTYTWGGQNINNYTGSLYVDDVRTDFSIPSASLTTKTHNVDGSGIFVGNYYNGPSSETSKFFNNIASENEGVVKLHGVDGATPTGFTFSSPLNAEIHELKIYNTHLSASEVFDRKKVGDSNLDDLIFYVPPYFYPSSSLRSVMQTPFH